jgi:hypothetical protein
MIEFDSANTHLSRSETASRLCGQITQVKDRIRTLKELLDHPGYASIEEVVMDIKSFGLTEKQEAAVREALIGGLEDRSEAEDTSTPDLCRSKFVLMF